MSAFASLAGNISCALLRIGNQFINQAGFTDTRLPDNDAAKACKGASYVINAVCGTGAALQNVQANVTIVLKLFDLDIVPVE